MKAPILLLLFNRPDLTVGLIQSLRVYAPDKVYVAIDGPRPSKEGEYKLCAEVRRIVESEIQWSCEIQWLVRDSNLGCGPAVKGALDWFFDNEELGIILEDDCHPSPDFFRFQEVMLHEHAENEEIFMVSGNSFLPEFLKPTASCYLTKYTSIWGWGTWRRSWSEYQFEYPQDEQASWERVIRAASSSPAEVTYWMREFYKLCNAKIPHTWDIQLQFSVWKMGRKNIFPSVNLVTNHGLRSDATHTTVFNERLFRKARNWNNEVAGISLPSYEPELDTLLFWMHVLEGKPERFKQLLLESAPELQERECKARDASRITRDPSLRDLVSLSLRWLQKHLGVSPSS